MSFTRIRNPEACKGLICSDDSLTEQHLKSACDINHIMNRLLGGDLTVCRQGGVFVDISEMPDNLQAVFNKQIDARRAYESMPDKVRERYQTAEEFYRAVNDENSRSTFNELGLLRKPEVVSPVKVEITNPVTPAKE